MCEYVSVYLNLCDLGICVSQYMCPLVFVCSECVSVSVCVSECTHVCVNVSGCSPEVPGAPAKPPNHLWVFFFGGGHT